MPGSEQIGTRKVVASTRFKPLSHLHRSTLTYQKLGKWRDQHRMAKYGIDGGASVMAFGVYGNS